MKNAIIYRDIAYAASYMLGIVAYLPSVPDQHGNPGPDRVTLFKMRSALLSWLAKTDEDTNSETSGV